MARPQRNNVDYFPFICDEGNKMFFIEQQYGNDGFATWVKILRELAKTDFHYLDLSKKTTSMFLSAKCKVSIEILEAIIKDLVDLEKFDKELWDENKIIWCQDFIDSIQDAYAKRSNKCIDRNSLIQLLINKGVRKQGKSTPKPPKSSSEGGVNPQTKGEDTKPNENKEENNYYDFEFLNLIKPNIKISINEYEKLCNEFTEEITHKAIIHFSNWKIEKGKESKSDYLTIRRWVIDAVTKQGQPKSTYQQGTQREPTYGGQTLTEIEKLNKLI